MKPFLRAFVRKTELFGSPAILSLTNNSTGPPVFDTWPTKAIIQDARADTVKRTLEGKANIIIRLCLQRQEKRLWLLLETREAISPKVDYILHLRLFGEGNYIKRIDLLVRSGRVEVLHRAACLAIAALTGLVSASISTHFISLTSAITASVPVAFLIEATIFSGFWAPV